jgi:cytochrome c-type protein NapB
MDSHDIESYFRQHQRTLGVLLLIIGMAAVSGAFMGMRQTEKDTAGLERFRDAETSDDHGDFKSAPRYADISEAGWLANEDWSFTLKNLPSEPVAIEDQTPLSSGELAVALAARSERRAFDGAPPTVPHEIDQMSSASCIVCHSADATLKIGDKRPAVISHPYYSSCTQCHVPADGLRRLTEDETRRLIVASAFEGREPAGLGSRAYVGAPPTVPHPLWMRQNCMSCHGPSREHAIKTSHPSRQNCLQCHAPDADFDNRERVPNSPPPADP